MSPRKFHKSLFRLQLKLWGYPFYLVSTIKCRYPILCSIFSLFKGHYLPSTAQWHIVLNPLWSNCLSLTYSMLHCNQLTRFLKVKKLNNRNICRTSIPATLSFIPVNITDFIFLQFKSVSFLITLILHAFILLK